MSRFLSLFFIIIFLQSNVYSLNKPKTQMFTLKNGLNVLHVHNDRAPVVVHMICYAAGSAEDMMGKSGTAHYLEHLMFRGTVKHPDGEFMKMIHENGAASNAFTVYDSTCYHQVAEPSRLETLMKFEADRMSNLAPNDQAFAKEQQVVLEEYEARIGNRKGGQLSFAVNASFFWQRAYGRPVLGWKHEIDKITKQDVLDYYKKWYMPNNAFLVVAGDIEFLKFKKLTEEYYGRVPKRVLPARMRLAEPQHFGETVRIEMRDQQIGCQVQMIFDAPNLRLGDKKDVYALLILEHIIGDGSKSKLYKSLVEEEKIAQSVYAFYEPYNYQPYSFGVVATPKCSIDIKELEYAMKASMKRIVRQGVTEEDLEYSKKQLKFLYYKHISDLYAQTRHYASQLSAGLNLVDIEAVTSGILDIKVEDINRTLNKYFKNDPRMTVVTVTSQKIEDAV
jgi:zinc protease